MPMTRKDGLVHITITDAEFDVLLIALGTATGAACVPKVADIRRSFIRLVNSINVGNPQFTPYEVEEAPK